MSIYQCEICGCAENTALGWYWYTKNAGKQFEGKKLCSACAPTHYLNGLATGLGDWHEKFERIYYPIGTMKTDDEGNLIRRLE
jgi:hypothetical protein